MHHIPLAACCPVQKKSFYREFNCILGKCDGVADQNLIMELVKNKCLPCLYFGLVACPVNKSVINSLAVSYTHLTLPTILRV